MVRAERERAEELERHLHGDELAAVLAVLYSTRVLSIPEAGAQRTPTRDRIDAERRLDRDDEELGGVPAPRLAHRLETHEPLVLAHDPPDLLQRGRRVRVRPLGEIGLAFVLRIVRSARPRSAPGSAETPAAAKSASAQSAETRRERARRARRARDRRAIARDRCAAPDRGRRPSRPRGLS